MEDNNLLLFECGICMENKTLENINFLPCIHFLCSKCYDKLIKNECPYCRNKIEDKEEDSYDEEENEYHDLEFEMLVLEEDRHRTRGRRKKYKKQEKKIMKLMNNNTEVFITINRNRYRVLSNLTEN